MNLLKIIFCFLTIYCLTLGGLTVRVWAKKPEQKLYITPHISILKYYDTNLFKVSDSKTLALLLNDTQRYDFVAHYLAGVNLDYPLSRQRVVLNGKRTITKYSHYKAQDFTNDSVSGKADLALGEKFFLQSENSFAETLISRIYNKNRAEPAFRIESSMSITGGYKAPRWKLSLLRRKNIHNYSLTDRLDKVVNVFGMIIEVVATGKSVLNINMRQKKFNFHNRANEFNNQEIDINMGGSIRLTGKSQLKVEGGYRGKTFKDSQGKNYKGVAGEISFLYQISSKIEFLIITSRDTESSYVSDVTYFIIDGIKSELLWHLTHRIQFKNQVEQRWLRSEGVTGINPLKEQRHFTGTMGLQYSLDQKVNIDLLYEYNNLKSNLEQYRFASHKYAATLSLLWK